MEETVLEEIRKFSKMMNASLFLTKENIYYQIYIKIDRNKEMGGWKIEWEVISKLKGTMGKERRKLDQVWRRRKSRRVGVRATCRGHSTWSRSHCARNRNGFLHITAPTPTNWHDNLSQSKKMYHGRRNFEAEYFWKGLFMEIGSN